jgi:hypothetical protein
VNGKKKGNRKISNSDKKQASKKAKQRSRKEE